MELCSKSWSSERQASSFKYHLRILYTVNQTYRICLPFGRAVTSRLSIGVIVVRIMIIKINDNDSTNSNKYDYDNDKG